MTKVALLLHNIRSVHNVGSIFRTADAVGVKKIILCGYTPGPLDRFGLPRADLHKAALGAEESVSWEREEQTVVAIEKLKQQGYAVVALEQDARAIDYKAFRAPERCALVLGEERHGLSRDILEQCDVAIEIPMRGRKESLNVSVAAGVALFRVQNI